MLMRWDPLREFDRLSQQAWGQHRPVMPIDAYRRGDQFVVHVDLPGMDPSSIDVTVEDNVLTLRAERAWARTDGDEVLVAERPQGAFARQLFLGDSLDTDHIQAQYEHGVLTLTIPVAERARPRKVQIATGATGPAAVEATSVDASAGGGTRAGTGDREPALAGAGA